MFSLCDRYNNGVNRKQHYSKFHNEKANCAIKEEKIKCQTSQAKTFEFISKSSVMELVEMLGSFICIRSTHLQKNFSQNTLKNHTKFQRFSARIQLGIVEFTLLGHRGKTSNHRKRTCPSTKIIHWRVLIIHNKIFSERKIK